jgi:hypothetical protein
MINLNKRLFLCWCIWASSALSAFASTTITVDAFVHDPNGIPIPNAEVTGYFMFYKGIVDDTRMSTAVTDKEGKARIKGEAQFDYDLAAKADGFYGTSMPNRSISTETGLKKYALGPQVVSIELRPKIAPISPIGYYASEIPLPATTEKIGYDLLVGDWVVPFGRGVSSDFLWKFEREFTDDKNWKMALTLSFSRADDGIQYYKINPIDGSEFKYPYEAPIEGYIPKLYWFDTKANGKFSTTFNNESMHQYLFRVRTERDEMGRIIKGLYGIVYQVPTLAGGSLNNPRLSFAYKINPNWTRNLEFDTRSGSGKRAPGPKN